MHVSDLINEYYKRFSAVKKDNRIPWPKYRLMYLILFLLMIIITIPILFYYPNKSSTKANFIASASVMIVYIIYSEIAMRRINVLDEKDTTGSGSVKQNQRERQGNIISMLKQTLSEFNIDYKDSNQMLRLTSEVIKEKAGRLSAGSAPRILKATVVVFIVPGVFIAVNKYISDYHLNFAEVVELISMLSCIVVMIAGLFCLLLSVYEMLIEPWITRKEDRLINDINTLLLFYQDDAE